MTSSTLYVVCKNGSVGEMITTQALDSEFRSQPKSQAQKHMLLTSALGKGKRKEDFENSLVSLSIRISFCSVSNIRWIAAKEDTKIDL